MSSHQTNDEKSFFKRNLQGNAKKINYGNASRAKPKGTNNGPQFDFANSAWRTALSPEAISKWHLKVTEPALGSLYAEKNITLLNGAGMIPVIQSEAMFMVGACLGGFGYSKDGVETKAVYYINGGVGGPDALHEANKTLRESQEEFFNAMDRMKIAILILEYEHPMIKTAFKEKIFTETIQAYAKYVTRDAARGAPVDPLILDNLDAITEALESRKYNADIGISQDTFDKLLDDTEKDAFEAFCRHDSISTGFYVTEEKTEKGIVKVANLRASSKVWTPKNYTPNAVDENKAPPADEETTTTVVPNKPTKPAQKGQKNGAKAEEPTVKLSDEQKRASIEKMKKSDKYTMKKFSVFLGNKQQPQPTDILESPVRSGAVGSFNFYPKPYSLDGTGSKIGFKLPIIGNDIFLLVNGPKYQNKSKERNEIFASTYTSLEQNDVDMDDSKPMYYIQKRDEPVTTDAAKTDATKTDVAKMDITKPNVVVDTKKVDPPVVQEPKKVVPPVDTPHLDQKPKSNKVAPPPPQKEKPKETPKKISEPEKKEKTSRRSKKRTSESDEEEPNLYESKTKKDKKSKQSEVTAYQEMELDENYSQNAQSD
jgi:hypothetical protein